MEDRDQRPRVGPYRLVRQLEPGKLAERWLALDEREQSTHVLHRFALSLDRGERRRFIASVESLSALDHPHLLPLRTFSLGSGVGASAWVVTPYTGSQDGLLTLAALLAAKGGQMTPIEAERAMIQILDAVEYAHKAGHHHGEITLDEIMVDRRGSLAIELYGLARRLEGLKGGNAELVRDEVRSVVEAGYRLITGLPADEPRIPAGRLVRRLEPAWDEWLEAGLDPSGGYASAAEAREALPSMVRETGRRDKTGPVQVVLSRFRRVIGNT